jgi:hypothetical protein
MTERKFEALNVPPDALEMVCIEILVSSCLDGARLAMRLLLMIWPSGAGAVMSPALKRGAS